MNQQQRAVVQLAIDALEKNHYYMIDAGLPNQSMLNTNFAAVIALRQLLEQPVQEPVACAVCNEIHAILDADESKIIRDAKDGYPDGRRPRTLTLQERITALCVYASDWKRWCLEKENTTPPAQPAVPDGLIDRIKAAEQRIRDGHAPRRIPADPTDVDLVLAEVRYMLEGKPPPFWVKHTPPAPHPSGDTLTPDEAKPADD